jgi:hypothetical protein
MANDTTPLMLITNVGLAAASTALPQGPYIHIIQFQIGSAYGYTPDVNQTGIEGNLLYTGVPADYQSIGNNTLDIILNIPPEAGPWEFGEVAIFAADSNNNPYLFAIAVFESPQTKFSSLGTNVVSSYQLNCLLKLQQSTAIFQIDTSETIPYVYDIYQWSDVYPPTLSANPDIPSYNIVEPNSRGDGTLLITTNDNTRTYVEGAYHEIFPFGQVGQPFVVANSSATYIEVTQAQFNSLRVPTANRSMLVQTHAGFWRSVNNVAVSGNNYRLTLNCTNDGTYSNYPLPVIPQIGENVHIYSDYFTGAEITYEQIIDPPPPPNAANTGSPGLATAGPGAYISSPGYIAVAGMLHAPSVGTGRVLTSADNLSAEGSAGLASGVYSVISETYGVPNGYPYPAASNNNGTIYHTNVPDAMTQLLIPYSTTNNVQYRCTQSGDTNWSDWIPFVTGTNTGETVTLVQEALGGSGSFTATGRGICTITCTTDGNPGSTQKAYLNGVLVMTQTKGGGAGYGRWPVLTVSFGNGDTVSYNNTAGGNADISIYYWN